MQSQGQEPGDRAGNGAMTGFLARLLCRLGFHDYGVVDVSFGFGAGGSVETVECRRCGQRTTRRGGGS